MTRWPAAATPGRMGRARRAGHGPRTGGAIFIGIARGAPVHGAGGLAEPAGAFGGGAVRPGMARGEILPGGGGDMLLVGEGFLLRGRVIGDAAGAAVVAHAVGVHFAGPGLIVIIVD